MLLLFGILIFFMRQMQGGGKGGPMSFGKSKAKMMDQDKNKITLPLFHTGDSSQSQQSETKTYIVTFVTSNEVV